MASKQIWMEVRPGKVRYAMGGIRERFSEFLDDFRKILFLIRCDLKIDIFETRIGYFWLILEPALQATTYYVLVTVIFGMQANLTFGFFFISVTFWRSHATLCVSAGSFFTSRALLFLQINSSVRLPYLEFIGHEVFLFGIRVVILLLFLMFSGVPVTAYWLLIVPIALVQFTLTASLIVWLSVFGAFSKDFTRIFAHFIWLWWYMSPGLYEVRHIPEWVRPVYELNPFAHILPALRNSILLGEAPPAGPLLAILLVSLILLVAGMRQVRVLKQEMSRAV